MTGPGPAGQLRSEINVTPFIDVLLVLLVIFIMVTPLLTTAMDSSIPTRAGRGAPDPGEQLLLHIRGDGRCVLNQEELSRPELYDRLRSILARSSARSVLFLDPDDRVRYGTVIEVMDLCRSAGIQDIGLVTGWREDLQPGHAPARRQ